MYKSMCTLLYVCCFPHTELLMCFVSDGPVQFVCLTNHRKSDVWCWCSQTGRQAESWWERKKRLKMTDRCRCRCRVVCAVILFVFSTLPDSAVWNSSLRCCRPHRNPPAITAETPTRWNADTSGTLLSFSLMNY